MSRSQLQQVAPAEERPFQARPEPLQLVAVVGEEPADVRRVGRAELGDLGFEPRHVRRAVELAAGAEDEAVLRVEPDHRHFARAGRGRRPEDAFEHPRVEEERRPEVEAEAVGLDRGAPAADARQPLEDVNVEARPAPSSSAAASPPGPAPMIRTVLRAAASRCGEEGESVTAGARSIMRSSRRVCRSVGRSRTVYRMVRSSPIPVAAAEIHHAEHCRPDSRLTRLPRPNLPADPRGVTMT